MNKNLITPIIAIVILVVGWLIYNNYFSNSNVILPKTSDTKNVVTQVFSSADHKLSLNYPKIWNATDLGGDKNVKTPSTMESVQLFYDDKNLLDKSDPVSVKVSAELLRFVIEDIAKIESTDDWFNYIKNKVDKFISITELSSNYNLVKLEKIDNIDGKFTISETYTQGDFDGKDVYIYNSQAKEFYQLVTKTPKGYYSKFKSFFDTIILSIKVGN